MALLNNRLNDPSTQLPSLADADEDLWTECTGDCLANWMQNNEVFFIKQQKKMITAALEPFMFCVTSFVPKAWIDLLIHGSVLDAYRLMTLGALTEDEHYMLGLAEQMFERCAQLVNNKHDVKTILNFIHDVEERPKRLEGVIDIGFAEKEVGSLQIFTSLWAPIRRIYDKKKSEAKICIIYFFKIIQSQIVTYGREGIDRIDFCKARYLQQASKMDETFDHFNSLGGDAYRNGSYSLAGDFYTEALVRDPFSHSCFGNRGQTSLRQGDYWSALWDCKRALIRDPTNSKNCYRYARACMELGWLEEALDMNSRALKHCVVELQRVEIIKQRRLIEGKSKRRRESESESNSSTKTKTQPVYNCQDTINLLSLLVEGCGMYEEGKFKASVEVWAKAITVVGDLGLKRLEISLEDVTHLKFFHALAMVKSGAFHSLMTALDKFAAIESQAPHFLAVFYGLALAYFKLNRFDQALHQAKRGLETLKKHGEKWHPTWTLVSSEQITKEISKEELKVNLVYIVEESSYPPKPDAVCRYHQDTQNPRLEIYLKDPDYKGFIRVLCGQECCVEFHNSCWKAYRATMPEKTTDKSMIDSRCPTPDCNGFIHFIEVFRSESEKPVEIVSTLKPQPNSQPPRPITKTKTSNQEKVKKKTEKKLARKQKKAEQKKEEKQIEEQKNEEEKESNSRASKLASNNKEPTVYKGEATVLLKDEPEDVIAQLKSKSSKTKKKKEKTTSKHILEVDVQFKDNGKLLYGADSVDYDFPNNVGLLPMPGTAPLPVGNGLLTVPSSIPYPPDVTANVLFELFEDIFRAHGPQFLGSPLLQDVMKDFPEEATKKIISYGGLYNFLYSNKTFDIIAGRIVCVREDTQKAHAMAEAFFRDNTVPGGWQPHDMLLMPGSPDAGGAAAATPVLPASPPKPTFSWDQRAREMAARQSSAGVIQNGDKVSSVIAPDELPSLQASLNDKTRVRSQESDDSHDGFVKISRKKSTNSTTLSTMAMTNAATTSNSRDLEHFSKANKIRPHLSEGPALDSTMEEVSSEQLSNSSSSRERSSSRTGNGRLDYFALPEHDNSPDSSVLTTEKTFNPKSQSPDLDLASLTNSFPDLSAKGSDDTASVMDSVDDEDEVVDDDNDIRFKHQVAASLSKEQQEKTLDIRANVLPEEPTPQLLSNLGTLLGNSQRRDSESSSQPSDSLNQALRSDSPALSQGSSGSNQSHPPPLKPLMTKGGLNILPRLKKRKGLATNSNQLTPSSSLSQSSLESSGSKNSLDSSTRKEHQVVSGQRAFSLGGKISPVNLKDAFHTKDNIDAGDSFSQLPSAQVEHEFGASPTPYNGVDPVVLEIFNQFNKFPAQSLMKNNNVSGISKCNGDIGGIGPFRAVGGGVEMGRGVGRGNFGGGGGSGDGVLSEKFGGGEGGAGIETGTGLGRRDFGGGGVGEIGTGGGRGGFRGTGGVGEIGTGGGRGGVGEIGTGGGRGGVGEIGTGGGRGGVGEIGTGGGRGGVREIGTGGGRGGVGEIGTGGGRGEGFNVGGVKLLESMGKSLGTFERPLESEKSHMNDGASSSDLMSRMESVKKLWSMEDDRDTGSTREQKDFHEKVLSSSSMAHSPYSHLLASASSSSSSVFPSHHTESSSVPNSLFDGFFPRNNETLGDNFEVKQQQQSSSSSSSSSSAAVRNDPNLNFQSQPYLPSFSSVYASSYLPSSSYSAFGLNTLSGQSLMDNAGKTPLSSSALSNTEMTPNQNSLSLSPSALLPAFTPGVLEHPQDQNRKHGSLINDGVNHLPTPIGKSSFTSTDHNAQMLGKGNNSPGAFNPLAPSFHPSSNNTGPGFNSSTDNEFESPGSKPSPRDWIKDLSNLNPNSKEFMPTSSKISVPVTVAACQTDRVKMESVSVNTLITGKTFNQMSERIKEEMKRSQELKEELDKEKSEMKEAEATQEVLNRKLHETKTALEMEWRKNKELEEMLEGLRNEVQGLQGENADLRKQASKFGANGEVMELERNRAITAERKILQISAQLMGQKLEGKKSEAAKHIAQLQSVCVSFSSNKLPVPAAILVKQKEWHDFVVQCDLQLDKLQHYFDQQTGQLNKGRLLKDLPEVSAKIMVPEMPKPPSGIESSLSTSDKSLEEDVGEKGASGGETEDRDDGDGEGQRTGVTRRTASYNLNFNGGGPPLSPKQASSLNGITPLMSLSRFGQQGGNPNNNNSLSAPPGLKPLSIPAPLQPRMPFGPSHTLLQKLSQPSQQHQHQAAAAPQQQQQTTFDKIVEEMQKSFPIFTREVIATLLEVLRRNNGGSLTHLTVSRVIVGLRELVFGIMGQKPEEIMAGDGLKFDPRMVSGLMRQQSEEMLKSPSPTPLKFKMEDLPVISRTDEEEYENFCPICHEDMDPKTATTLDCQHTFHEECIRRWFQQQRSCPNCRVYSLLKDDFPSLK